MTTEDKAKYERALASRPVYLDTDNKTIAWYEEHADTIRAALTAQIARLDRETSGGVDVEVLKLKMRETRFSTYTQNGASLYHQISDQIIDHLASIGALAQAGGGE